MIIGLVGSGDSITGCPDDYWYQAFNFTSVGDCGSPLMQSSATYLYGGIPGVSLLCRNMGISGTRLDASNPDDLTPLAPIWIDPIIPVVGTPSTVRTNNGLPYLTPVRRYIFTTAIGSNDGAIDSYATVAQYAAAVAVQCVLRKTAGYNLAGISSLLPRGDGLMTEPNRFAYNALVTSPSWRQSNGVDFVVDLASQTIMGNPANLPVNNGGNTTYYQSDNVHPTTLGSSLLGPIYLAAVTAAVNSLL